MSIERLIVEAQYRHTIATGKEPSRVYLGLNEAAAFKEMANKLQKWAACKTDDEHLGKPPTFCGMTVYYVTEAAHLFVA